MKQRSGHWRRHSEHPFSIWINWALLNGRFREAALHRRERYKNLVVARRCISPHVHQAGLSRMAVIERK